MGIPSVVYLLRVIFTSFMVLPLSWTRCVTTNAGSYEGDKDGDTDGLTDALGDTDGDIEGLSDGEIDGDFDGLTDDAIFSSQYSGGQLSHPPHPKF